MTLEEAIKIVNKQYNNFKHDPNPKIYIIDDNYKEKYILGFNLNYFDNQKEAKQKLNKILKFSKHLNKLDTYKEIKKQFPDSIKYLRTYKKEKFK